MEFKTPLKGGPMTPTKEQREEAARLYAQRYHADIAVNEASDEDYPRLQAAADLAEHAYKRHGLDVDITWAGEIKTCTISGVPLLTTDEVFEDVIARQYILREALNLPPRQIEDAEVEIYSMREALNLTRSPEANPGANNRDQGDLMALMEETAPA
jgi:hypothetical protein